MSEDMKREGPQEGLDQELDEQKVKDEQLENMDAQEETTEQVESLSGDKDGAKALEVERDKYLRLQAEFMNYKKRVEKEKSEIYKNASAKLIADLLPVLDDFDRALAHAGDANTFMDGMKLIVRRFEDCLKKEGLEVIETVNSEFDPNFHHAVMMEETDVVESGKIFEEVQKGYKVNGRVIRPAMVKVAK